MPKTKTKKTNYGWRTYLSNDIERPAKIAAIQNGQDVREYLSKIIKANLPEVIVR